MPWPRASQIAQSLQFVVFIDHLQRDRAAERCVLPDAAKNLDLIGLDALPSAATVTPLPATQFDVD